MTKTTETSTNLVKPLTKEEIKIQMKEKGDFDIHPNTIYKEIGKILCKDRNEITQEEKEKLGKKLAIINNFDTYHIILANTSNENIQTALIELTNDIIQEYNCNTTLEKSLCEIIANSYGKIMQISKKITTCMNAGEFLSDERTRYLSMLSKELDRENRAYLNSMNNLLEMKKPQMNINIKTKNAYIGQNQQFNNNIQEDENNKD